MNLLCSFDPAQDITDIRSDLDPNPDPGHEHFLKGVTDYVR